MLFIRCLLMVANFDLLFYTHNSFQFKRKTDFFLSSGKCKAFKRKAQVSLKKVTLHQAVILVKRKEF